MNRPVPRLALLALLAAGCSSSAPPVDPPVPARAEPRAALSAEGREAYAILRDATRFTDDAIYDDGTTPVEVRALRRLLREDEAPAALAQLLDEATLPGRLFALCGLWFADPARFAASIGPYRASDATVFFQTGCVGLPDQPVAELVESRGPNPARLAGPGETVKAWVARAGATGGYTLDLLGGGYPSELVQGGGWYEVRPEPLDDPGAF